MIDVSSLDRTKTTALVIRHADRDKMAHAQIFQPLNEAGKRNAYELGTKIRGFRNYLFFSSPVDRCVETAQNMQSGISTEKMNKPIESTLLGEPGPFVINQQNNAFKTTSLRTVVKKQIAHESLEGIRTTEEGTKIFVDFILSQLKMAPDGTLLVFVTHDAILAPVISELTGEEFGHENWPGFSDGFFMEDRVGKYVVIRNGKAFEPRMLCDGR